MSTRSDTRATSPRDSGSRSRSRWCWSRPRRWSCSTSPPAAWTTRPRPGWSRRCAGSPPPVTPWCWPRTTSSWSPRWPTVRSCWPTASVVADGPTADVVVGSPAFAPQVAKVLAPRTVAHGRRGRPGTASGRMSIATNRAGRVRAPVAVRIAGRPVPALLLVSLVGLVALRLAAAGAPGQRHRARRRRAVAVRGAAAAAHPRAARRDRRPAASTRRRSRCSACWPRVGDGAATVRRRRHRLPADVPRSSSSAAGCSGRGSGSCWAP